MNLILAFPESVFISKIHFRGVRLNLFERKKQNGGTKMKRTIALMLALLMVVSPAVFAAKGESGVGAEGMGEGGMGEGGDGAMAQEGEMAAEQTMTQERARAKAGTPQELKSMIQSRKQAMEQEMQGMDEDMQKVYRNQNQVREAVHALLAMEDLAGGIGKQVSEVARNFNNSVMATIRAEEKIQTRGGFSRFFAGGDHEAADKIEQEVNQNRQRIEQLKQMKAQVMDGEVQGMFQEQIQLMEKEQTRLQQMAQEEKSSKGLLGWIWK